MAVCVNSIARFVFGGDGMNSITRAVLDVGRLKAKFVEDQERGIESGTSILYESRVRKMRYVGPPVTS